MTIKPQPQSAQDDTNTPHAVHTAAELRVLICRLNRQLRERANLGELTPSQVSVLVRLEREGDSTVTALAKAEGIRSQSMGAIVAALETAGLISGQADPKDKRQTILSLTPACRELIQKNRAVRQDWLLQAIQTKLSIDEQRQLGQAVELLKRLADI